MAVPVAEVVENFDVIKTDIWRSAHMMIELYDRDAGWRAAQRADHLHDAGDIDGFHVWVRIVEAIKQLQKVEPADKDMRH